MPSKINFDWIKISSCIYTKFGNAKLENRKNFRETGIYLS